MKLRRIKWGDFLKLTSKDEVDRYIFAIQYAEEYKDSKDILNIGRVTDLSFGMVKDYQGDLGNGRLTLEEQIKYVISVLKVDNLDNYYLDEITRTCAYMLEGMIEIIEIEKQLLVSGRGNTDEEIEAGIDMYQQLGVFNQISSLATDITKYEAVKETKYETAFMYLLKAKIDSDFQYNLNEISKRKNK